MVNDRRNSSRIRVQRMSVGYKVCFTKRRNLRAIPHFSALSFLALFAVLAAASPVPQQPDVPEVPSAPGADDVATTAGKTSGGAAAKILPESVVANGIEGADGTPGAGQDNVSDTLAGSVGAAVKKAAPAYADGAVTGAGGTPGTAADGAAGTPPN
ncbi:uncharacterized protein LACBIDRAFT_291926 [Laccaria bicolor S238N-H82]|uniref:Predicted protein n=1 Tax=Laccaria bicolor (strain S238N-H82 / ATCC MYA-4686) TaxID=486041 RepID=B0CPZ1_LACBS|nr:uncharacterized protein LACBIDRAFT_291926 [Laccaria bicolor S238N-H82]EDR16149.1 predicted protein [Laccaria bicolor S238N-H82]|eukprot:XP_001874357.1 predicted protein [Laccaria bicolor S238N-H82]